MNVRTINTVRSIVVFSLSSKMSLKCRNKDFKIVSWSDIHVAALTQHVLNRISIYNFFGQILTLCSLPLLWVSLSLQKYLE